MKKYLIPTFLIALGIACRFLPHLPNFTPIGAIAIFGALYLPKQWSILLPIGALFISDIFIGFYSWPIMLSVYIGFILMGTMGLLIKKNKKFSTVIGGTLLGSIIFFLITNFAVWKFSAMYTNNFSGLINSYQMALPFFRNSLVGDLFYVAVLIGTYETVWYLLNKKDVKSLAIDKI